MKRKMIAALLAASMLITAVPSTVLAEETKTISEEAAEEIYETEVSEEIEVEEMETEEVETEDTESEAETQAIAGGVITEFCDISHVIHVADKLPLSELLELLPKTTAVRLEGQAEPQEIPVVWECDSNYDAADHYVYTFWAEWDQAAYSTAQGKNLRDTNPFVHVVIDSKEAFLPQSIEKQSQGIKNICERAHQQVNIRWTPLMDIRGFNEPGDEGIIFPAGVMQNGIPYGQPVSTGAYVPLIKNNQLTNTFDMFVDAVKNPASKMYTARGSYTSAQYDSPYYSSDCSDFVSYALNINRTTTYSLADDPRFTKVSGNSVYNAQEADIFNRKSYHVEMITDMGYDEAGNLVYIEVCEQTPPKARCVKYTPAELQALIDGKGYTLMRYNNRAGVPAAPNYNGYAEDMAAADKIVQGVETNPAISFTDISGGKQTEIQVKVSNLKDMGNGSYMIAFWSKEKDQDDIHWVTLTKGADGCYSCIIKASDFKHSGLINAHLYRKDSKMTYIMASTYELAKVSAESVTIENFNQSKGTFSVYVHGVACAAGVKEVQVPVWCAADQSDLYWYKAYKVDNDTWCADVSIENHKKHIGKYTIHVYGTAMNGFRNVLKAAYVEITAEAGQITTQVSGTTATLKATGVYLPGGVKGVTIAIWSQENDRDDLKWTAAKYDAAARTASLTVNLAEYKHYGTFEAHAYMVDTNGKMNFLAKTTFEAKAPAVNQVAASVNRDTGDFRVTLSRPSLNGRTITRVRIPIWSKANQGDIIWYEAKKASDGSYYVDSNLSKHVGPGTYNCHVYAEAGGKMTFLNAVKMEAPISNDELTVGYSIDERLYPLRVRGTDSPLPYTYMKAAVWSSDKGQDDLKWYTLSGSGDFFGGTIDIANHKSAGDYKVDVYAVAKATGKMFFVGTTTFNVTPNAVTSVKISNKNSTAGTMLVTVGIESSSSAVNAVTVPVWTKQDQSDIYWYKATRQTNGTYTVLIDKKNHKNNVGTYQIHIYTTFYNKLMRFSNKTSTDLY